MGARPDQNPVEIHMQLGGLRQLYALPREPVSLMTGLSSDIDRQLGLAGKSKNSKKGR